MGRCANTASSAVMLRLLALALDVLDTIEPECATEHENLEDLTDQIEAVLKAKAARNMSIEKFAHKPRQPQPGKKPTYIAGPMTGLPDLNFPAFHARAAELRALGHDVVNPAEINPDKSLSWQQCMRTDIAALVFCDAIELLPGWESSKGATLEHHIAERLGLEIGFAPGARGARAGNCSRHPSAPHGPDGGKCQCQNWAPGEAS